MLELIVVVLLDILLVKLKLKVNSEIITIYFFIYFLKLFYIRDVKSIVTLHIYIVNIL